MVYYYQEPMILVFQLRLNSWHPWFIGDRGKVNGAETNMYTYNRFQLRILDPEIGNKTHLIKAWVVL